MTDGQPLIYHDPPWRSHAESEAIFANGGEEAICDALVGAALKDDDAPWIEDWCVILAANQSTSVRGIAAVCLGHVVRRFGRLNPASLSLLDSMRNDEQLVAVRASDALEDVTIFSRTSA